MTAPRETGGEGRIEELEQMVFAMMATDSLGNVIPADAPEANRRLTAYRDALLATPRPVEVTEGMVEAALEYERSTYQQGAVENDLDNPFVQREARKFYRGILTAALRAQPAGGTPEVTLASLWGAAPDLRCEKCAPILPPVGERETVEDVELMNDVALAVLCRVFEDGADEGYQEWLALDNTQWFFDKTQWCWWGRALGAFIAGRLARLATRPSPAPSGEPVEWQLCARKQGSEPWGPTRPRSWMRYDSATERDRVAANLAREHIVETRELYAAAPHPDGQGVGE